jgi:glutamate dehydrogenase
VVEAAIAAVLNGKAEDDAFNRLITATALAAHEANWLRAWYRYLRQATLSFGIGTAVDALANAPQVARGLIALFVARHDPGFAGNRAKAEQAADRAIREGLAQVSAINDDRLLRHYRALVEAILRSNTFITPQRGAPEVALAFKIDSAAVRGLPKPVPWREIFVYSRRVEGIHLRAGPVARGGLRWSDRRDDFRTEVLGLMKAQRVKNAVIVPTGAKGGFYPKRLPDPMRDREGWLAEGKASYQVFVRSLLALTDNIVGAKVVHPKGMVIRDGEDPYFVVAADKGTATFSDTANALAEEKDFWLDDAFASGGSKGYDHKEMGITARGAWISVQRHFLERGVDVQTESVRVVGCGDMSGDVFGNGMLLSQAIKLVAAFDHRHVFLDPDPDPAKSWAERKRLFDLARSSWDDYDKSLISEGGGVFARAQKAIPLSPEAREALGIEADSTDPETLIAAILRAPVDLLWFGGIGTYVKAEAENNVQVGDPANDALRVNGTEVRAHVIGEGANLGCTQAGRIEFALHAKENGGGRLNTDFIDNSAGVDCSDNEVNIKIALASAKRDGRLTEKARVKLLGEMTADVAEIVLEDNRLQALGLSNAEAPGPAATPSYIRVIEMLEERGQLDRKTEGLADNETLARRAADGQGLTRPELAVLLSSAKLALQEALEDSQLPDDPGLTQDLLAAFPPQMRRTFRADILEHRLRREIIATKLANRMINRLGLVHPFELVEQEGATLAQVATGFVAAERLFGMATVWRAIEDAAMPEPARIQLFARAARALRPQIADLLRAGAGEKHPSELVEALKHGIDELAQRAQRMLGQESRAASERLRGELIALGAPERETGAVAHLFDMDGAVGLSSLARDIGVTASALTAAFIDLGTRLGLDWAQASAVRMIPTDTWERLLVAGLARDFQQMRLDFLRRTVSRTAKGKGGEPAAAVDRWAEAQAPAIRQFRATIARARASVAVSPAILAQLASQARNLLAR